MFPSWECTSNSKRLSNEAELATASPTDLADRIGDDVLAFINRRAILTNGSRVHLNCRSDAYRALLHDSRGRNTASRHERNRRHNYRLADPPRTDQERRGAEWRAST